jgi:hypothetical protein
MSARERSLFVRLGAGALAALGLGALLVLLLPVGGARAATTHTLTVVPASSAGDVALTGQTYEQVVRALSKDSTPVIPLSIPGLSAISNVPVALQPADTVNNVITLMTEAPQDLFGPGSPFDTLPLSLMLIVDWDDPKLDTIPDVVLALRAPGARTLEALFPLWGDLGLPPLPAELADVVTLTDAVLPLVGSELALDPSTLPSVVNTFLGLDEVRELDEVSSLLGDLDLSAMPSALQSLELLAAEAGGVDELFGSLDDSAAWLFDGSAAPGDFDLAAPISVDSGSLPDWLQDRLPSFHLTIGGAPDHEPSFGVHDSFDIVTGGVTNSFDYEVALEDARDLDVTVETDAFVVPFGLDWMGELTNVALRLQLDDDTDQLDATFDADLPIASPAPRAHIQIQADPLATAASVDVEGDVSGNDVTSWLAESDTFSVNGLDPTVLGELVLHSFELTYDSAPAGEHVSLFADATLPVPDFVASPEVLDVTALLAASDPDGDGPAATTILAALRAVDPGCDLDVDAGGIQPCIHVSALLPFPSGSVAGDLVMPEIDLLTVQPQGGAFPTTGLGEDGAAFLADILGSEPADPFVIDADVRVVADVPQSVLSPVMSAVGLSATGPLHLTGDLAFTLEDLALGDIESVDLTASMDGIDFDLPSGTPDWFDEAFGWPSLDDGGWTLTAHFDDGTDPDAPSDDTVSLALSLDGVTTTLLAGADPLSVSAEIAGNVDACDYVVTLTGAMGEWAAPFGIEWLTVGGASVVVELTIDDCALTGTEVTLQGLFSVGDEPTVDLAVTLEIDALGDSPSVTIQVGLTNTITVGEVLEGLFDFDTSIVPDDILAASFGPGSLTAVLSADDLRVSVVLDTSFSLGGDPIEISAMALAEFSLTPTFELTSFSFGVQPKPGLMMSDLLPGVELPEIQMAADQPPVPLDFALTGPDSAFAFVFSEGGVDVNGLGLPDAATCASDPNAVDCDLRGWFAPLFGGEPSGEPIAGGLRVVGALGLPGPLADFVEMIGVQPDVLLSGGLSFDPIALDVSLSLRLDPDILPSFVYDGITPSISIELSLDADLRLQLTLEGSLILKLQQGLNPVAADAMALLGLDEIPRAEGSATELQDDDCDGLGIADSEPVDVNPDLLEQDLEDQWFCYDLLEVEIGASIAVAALPTPRIEAAIFGGISVVNASGIAAPGGGWHPMGLPFVTVNDLFAQIVLRLEPASATPVNINFGARGQFSIGTTEFTGAVQVGLGIVPGSPPVVTPTFEGIRMGISELSLTQLINLQSQIASVSSTMPDLATVLDDVLLAVPDFALRHLELSLSPLGVESLCIPLGIKIRADLYVDASIPAFDFPRCVDGVMEPTPDEELCPANAPNGCVAGVFLELGLGGIRANGFVAGFDLGPLHTDAMLLDLVLQLTDQHLELSGGITLDLPLDPETVLARGYGRIYLSPTAVAVDAEVEVYELFQAYVHLAGTLDLVNPGFEVDVVFRGGSDFADTVSQLVEDAIGGVVADAEIIADGVTALIGTEEDAREAIDRLGSDAPAAADDLWLSHRIKGFHAAMDQLDLALPAWLLIDLDGNDEPDLEQLDIATPDFAGVVVDAINLGLGATCFVADPDEAPEGDPDGFGDDLGLPCTWDALKQTAGNLLADAIPELGDPGAAAGDLVGDLIDAADDLFSLECAAFSAELSTLGASVNLAVIFEALGEEHNLSAGWTFTTGFASVEDFVDAILAFFFNGGTGTTVCDVPALTGPASGVFAVASPSPVSEGATVTLSGSFAVPPAEERSVTIDWGDGSDTTFTTEEPTFSRTHQYDDDGDHIITVTAGDDDAVAGVTVTNVAPVVAAAPTALGIEGALVVPASASFTDAGADDTHTATISWGDGSTTQAATVVGGVVTFPAHRYPDSGSYTAFVCVEDDDGGTGCDTTAVTITNVAPVTTAGAGTSGNEGSPITVGASFTDAGTLDTHTATIDWGDGTSSTGIVTETTSGPPGSATPMTGSVAGSHVYADDGSYTVTVCVEDDDGAAALEDCDGLQVEVANVAPVTTAGVDKVVGEGSIVTVAATFGDDGTLDAHTATVDWDDGTSGVAAVTESPFGPPGDEDGMSGAVSASHVYADDGVYGVEICVTDDEAGEHCATLQVTVTNVAPTVDAGPDQIAPEGALLLLEPATFNDRGTNDSHTSTVSWGDGTIAAVGVVTESPFGPPGATTGANGSVASSHVYGDDGTYTVFVCVTDDDGATTCDRLRVVVTNVAPTATIGTIGQGPGFFLPHVDVTVDGSFHDQGTLDTHSATFDWGDTTSTAATVTEDPFGPPGSVDGMDGTVASGHAWTHAGLFEVTLTVTDDDGGTGTDTTEVEVVTPEVAVTRVIEWVTELYDSEANAKAKAALLEALKDLDGPQNKPNAGAVDKLRDGDDPAALQKIADAMVDLRAALVARPALADALRDVHLVLTQVAESVSATLLLDAADAIDPTSAGAAKQVRLLQELHDDATARSAAALVLWDGGSALAGADAFRSAVVLFHQVAREANVLM